MAITAGSRDVGGTAAWLKTYGPICFVVIIYLFSVVCELQKQTLHVKIREWGKEVITPNWNVPAALQKSWRIQVFPVSFRSNLYIFNLDHTSEALLSYVWYFIYNWKKTVREIPSNWDKNVKIQKMSFTIRWWYTDVCCRNIGDPCHHKTTWLTGKKSVLKF